MLVDGRNVVLKEGREEQRSSLIATRICVGLPSNSFALQRAVAAVAGQSLRSRSCLSIYFLATLQLLLSFHHFTPFRHLLPSIASSVRASEPLPYSRAGQHFTVDTIRQTANMGEAVVGLIGMGDMGKMYARRLSEAGWRYAFAPNITLLV